MKKLFFLIINLTFIGNLYSQDDFNRDIDYKGFFNFQYELKSNKIFLELDELDRDFLYINSLKTGLGSNDIGLDRGKLGKQRIVRFKRYGNKILLIQPNLKYRANSENIAERKSVEEAFAFSVIFGFDILESSSNKFKIDLTPFYYKILMEL